LSSTETPHSKPGYHQVLDQGTPWGEFKRPMKC